MGAYAFAALPTFQPACKLADPPFSRHGCQLISGVTQTADRRGAFQFKDHETRLGQRELSGFNFWLPAGVENAFVSGLRRAAEGMILARKG